MYVWPPGLRFPQAVENARFASWHIPKMFRNRWLVVLCALGLGACSLPERPEAPNAGLGTSNRLLTTEQRARELLLTPDSPAHWERFLLPGKRSAPFEPVTAKGRPALRVHADRSVSILRRRFVGAEPSVRALSFSWKVDMLPLNADLRDAQAEDSPVRVVLAFGGDRTQLTARHLRLSELTRLVTGEELPYATLAYVWSNHEPLETVIRNPRTDRIRKLVVASGAGDLGQWLDYRRDVRADFIRAFGEEPGPLQAIALMTDTDNTQSALQAWYGALRLEPAATASLEQP